MAGAQCEVAIGRGDRCNLLDGDVVTRVDDDAAVGGGDRGGDIGVAAAAQNDVAVGCRDRGVDVDVPHGVQPQRRGAGRSRPRDGLIDVDVAVAGSRGEQARDRGGAGDRRVIAGQGADNDTVRYKQRRQRGT